MNPKVWSQKEHFTLPGRWFLRSGSTTGADGTGGVRTPITPGLWWPPPLSFVLISVCPDGGEVLDGDIPDDKDRWLTC